MWRKCDSGDDTRPAELDTTSSHNWNYVRKDITFIPAEEGEDGRPAHYEWLEMKGRKDDWAVYEQVMGHSEALDDVYAALTELAELIVEG